MKRLILSALLLGTSVVANAGTYTARVQIEMLCNQIGEMAKLSYLWRQNGGTLDSILAKLGKEREQMTLIMIEATKRGYNADSIVNAGLLGWAACKDHYE